MAGYGRLSIQSVPTISLLLPAISAHLYDGVAVEAIGCADRTIEAPRLWRWHSVGVSGVVGGGEFDHHGQAFAGVVQIE
ncbi:hypothetical protein, partial [Nocardia gipuzkoensis]